jgi:predicted nucleic-acid-binding protein
MVFFDTSSLIRFFTNDEPKKALKVKEVLEKEKKIFIPEVVFPELEYVLRGNYKAGRKKVTEVFQFLIAQPSIKLDKKVKKAVAIFKSSRLDMADCLVAAHSMQGKLASFDKKLLEVRGIKKYW